jgi:uncharacterized protein (TIGR03067 family)
VGLEDSSHPPRLFRRNFMSKRALVILTLGCCLIAFSSVKADDKDKKDSDALQGTWRVQSQTISGAKLPEKDAKEYTYVFKGENYTQFEGRKKQVSGKFKLEAGKSPKVIAMTMQSGKEKGITDLWIYDLDGDTLKMCTNDEDSKKLPTDFTSEKGSDRTLLVLKREKAK